MSPAELEKMLGNQPALLKALKEMVDKSPQAPNKQNAKPPEENKVDQEKKAAADAAVSSLVTDLNKAMDEHAQNEANEAKKKTSQKTANQEKQPVTNSTEAKAKKTNPADPNLVTVSIKGPNGQDKTISHMSHSGTMDKETREAILKQTEGLGPQSQELIKSALSDNPDSISLFDGFSPFKSLLGASPLSQLFGGSMLSPLMSFIGSMTEGFGFGAGDLLDIFAGGDKKGGKEAASHVRSMMSKVKEQNDQQLARLSKLADKLEKATESFSSPAEKANKSATKNRLTEFFKEKGSDNGPGNANPNLN